ncbi:MAG: hypothetical protein R3C14_39785 [Caldilineaceae bacterium]
MKASFSFFTNIPFVNSRRWLLVLIIAASLAIPALANLVLSDPPTTAATEQMELAGPREGFGG